MKTAKINKYETARNSLIPEAKKYANKVVGVRPPKKNIDKYEQWCNEWNFSFHTRMNVLAKEKGITG